MGHKGTRHYVVTKSGAYSFTGIFFGYGVQTAHNQVVYITNVWIRCVCNRVYNLLDIFINKIYFEILLD